MEHTRKELKKELKTWGMAYRLYKVLQAELSRYQRLQRELIKVPQDTRPALEKTYQTRIEAIEQEISRIRGIQEGMDRRICRLDPELALLLRLRYQEGISVDATYITLHMSRATFFRYQARALQELEEIRKKEKESLVSGKGVTT